MVEFIPGELSKGKGSRNYLLHLVFGIASGALELLHYRVIPKGNLGFDDRAAAIEIVVKESQKPVYLDSIDVPGKRRYRIIPSYLPL